MWQDLDRLARLLAVRIPLDRAVRTIARQSRRDDLRSLWEGIRQEVVNGTALADALRQRHALGPTAYTLVRAGEASGRVAETLQRLVQERRSLARLRQQVVSAAAYPLTVGALAIVIVTTLLTFVAPQFAEVYRQIPQLQGQPLPWLTRTVMGLPRVLLVGGLLGLTLGSGTVLTLRQLAARSTPWQARLQQWSTALPWWGRTRQLYTLIQQLQTTASALSVGLSLPASLRLNAAPEWQQLAERVQAGRRLSAAYLETAQPDLTVHSLLEVGEETHSLVERFAEAADLLKEELEARLNGLKTWLEPALLLGLATVVGMLVLAVFLPVIQLLQQAAPGR